MWHWLLEKVPKRFQLIFKLIVFSTGFHCLILFLLFFLYKGSTSIFSFDLSRIAIDTDATIVYMPLHKSLNGNQVNKKGGNAGKNNSQKDVTEKNIEPKRSLAKNEKSPTMLVAEKVRAKAKKKVAQKKETKNILAKKQEKDVEKKQKEAVQEEKKLEDVKVAHVDEKALSAQGAGDGSNIIYVGREDLEMLQLQQSICSEIGEHWKPPRGVPKDKTCVVRVLVDWHGVVKDIVVEKASGIAMYDVSVRSAVSALHVPQAAWGKELSITFKQA